MLHLLQPPKTLQHFVVNEKTNISCFLPFFLRNNFVLTDRMTDHRNQKNCRGKEMGNFFWLIKGQVIVKENIFSKSYLKIENERLGKSGNVESFIMLKRKMGIRLKV